MTKKNCLRAKVNHFQITHKIGLLIDQDNRKQIDQPTDFYSLYPITPLDARAHKQTHHNRHHLYIAHRIAISNHHSIPLYTTLTYYNSCAHKRIGERTMKSTEMKTRIGADKTTEMINNLDGIGD